MTKKRTLDFYAQSDESAIKFYTWYNQGNDSVVMLARNGEIISL